jgi:hypothetical protein
MAAIEWVETLLAKSRHSATTAVDRLSKRWRLRVSRPLVPVGRPPRIRLRTWAAVILLLAAASIGVYAYFLFHRATSIPQDPEPGALTLLTSSTDVEIYLGIIISGSLNSPDHSVEDYNTVQISIQISSRSSKPIHVSWALAIQSPLRLSEVYLNDPSGQRIPVTTSLADLLAPADWNSDVICSCQFVYGDMTLKDRSANALMTGHLSNNLAHSAAGVTYLGIPQIQSERPILYQYLTINSSPGKTARWYATQEANLDVQVGPFGFGDSITRVYPPVDVQQGPSDLPEITWRTHSLRNARVELGNRSEQQRANGMLFAAGAVVGLATALFVEALLRLGIFAVSDQKGGTPRKRRTKLLPRPRGRRRPRRRTTWY